MQTQTLETLDAGLPPGGALDFHETRVLSLCRIRHEHLELVTEGELGTILGVGEQRAIALRHRGVGPRHVVIGRAIYYRLEDVRAWVRALTAVPAEVGA